MVLLLTVLQIFDPAAIFGTNAGTGMLEARSGATTALYPSAGKIKQFLARKLGTQLHQSDLRQAGPFSGILL